MCVDQRSIVLQEEYQKRFEENAQYRDRVWKILCRDFLSRYVNDTFTILDLGAGWGEFSRNIKARKKFAMDLNPDCGKRVHGHAEFIQQDCSVEWLLQSETLDVVFTSNFLEHLPNKAAIDSALAEAFRCLKKGGAIICIGPNIRFVPGVYWDYWDHHVPLSDRSMAEALDLRGFSIKEVVPRFLPYTMSGGTNPPLLAVKAYVRMPWVWPIFGKQFLVVAQKN
jgi:ubiquinone/menaquinone biosynthesis C-methylase UbiE